MPDKQFVRQRNRVKAEQALDDRAAEHAGTRYFRLRYPSGETPYTVLKARLKL